MTGRLTPVRPRLFLSAMERPRRRRPTPPMPQWVNTVMKRTAEESSEQRPPVKRRTEPPVPEPEPEPELRPTEDPAPSNLPVAPSEASSRQNQGMVTPEDVPEEVVQEVQDYGTQTGPIRSAEEQDQQEEDDRELPPLADFLYRFSSGYAVIRNYVDRGLCGVQSLVDSLCCQEILYPEARVPTIEDLLDIYRQNVSIGTYNVSFEVTPEDRDMPGPYQAEILSHVISEWSRLHSSPSSQPYVESGASRPRRGVPPLVAGFYSEGERPFSIQATQPGTRIVWIYNSGNHWEGIRPAWIPTSINDIFRNYGHELFRNETAPQWFVNLVQQREAPVQIFPRFRRLAVKGRHSAAAYVEEQRQSSGGSISQAQAQSLSLTASQALDRLERLYRSRRNRYGRRYTDRFRET